MSTLPRISIRLHGGMSPNACVASAQSAENAGFGGIWFAENAFARGILPAAAACAAATRRIAINAGVFNPFSRHPTMMAMEIGALDEVAQGRATLSVGSGIATATEKLAMNPAKPVPGMRDTLVIVRGLLRGETVDHTGAFSARNVKLEYQPRSDISVYLAGRGELTAKLAGELADGLLVSNMCSLGFAARVAGLVQASRAIHGRAGPGEIVQYMPCSVGEDRRVALAGGKRAVGAMLPAFWNLAQKLGSAKEGLMADTGITENEYARCAERLRDGEDPVDVVDDHLAHAFALIGTADECLTHAAEYAAAGVTELALTFSGRDADEGIAALGRAVRHA